MHNIIFIIFYSILLNLVIAKLYDINTIQIFKYKSFYIFYYMQN